MRTTRAGFSNEDFYSSNDTDVVHFRWLHKVLRKVPQVIISDLPSAKFTQTFTLGRKQSKYGDYTYSPTVTTINATHEQSDHVVNPFIDDQLDKFYHDVVKPQIDRLDGRIDALQKIVDEHGKAITRLEGGLTKLTGQFDDLNGKHTELNNQVTQLQNRVHELEQSQQPQQK